MNIGRHYSGPRRNWVDDCDYCGARHHRHELVGPDADGFLRCPDDAEGRSIMEIDAQRAMDSAEPSTVRGKTRNY